jgi:hypothetical protein
MRLCGAPPGCEISAARLRDQRRAAGSVPWAGAVSAAETRERPGRGASRCAGHTARGREGFGGAAPHDRGR